MLLKNLFFQHDFIVGNIVSEHLKVVNSFNYSEKFNKIISSLKALETISVEEFEEILESKYADFSKAHPHMLENFIINWILNEIFPFKSESIYYELLRLVINFSLIRALLVVNSINKKSIVAKEAMEIIFLYARIFGNTELPTLNQNYTTNSENVVDLLFVLNNT